MLRTLEALPPSSPKPRFDQSTAIWQDRPDDSGHYPPSRDDPQRLPHDRRRTLSLLRSWGRLL